MINFKNCKVLLICSILLLFTTFLYSEETLLSNISIISDGDFTPDRFDFENGIVKRKIPENIDNTNINVDLYFEACSNKVCMVMKGGLVEMEADFNMVLNAPTVGYQFNLKGQVNKVYCGKTRNGFYVKFKILELNNIKRKSTIKIKWMCQKNGTNKFY